jgi:hypothetical protein
MHVETGTNEAVDLPGEKWASWSYLSGVLMAGLSRPGQNILWVTDNDAIAAVRSH